MTNRRTFIKTSSLAAAGVALASTMPMAACKGANERIFLFFRKMFAGLLLQPAIRYW